MSVLISHLPTVCGISTSNLVVDEILGLHLQVRKHSVQINRKIADFGYTGQFICPPRFIDFLQ